MASTLKKLLDNPLVFLIGGGFCAFAWTNIETWSWGEARAYHALVYTRAWGLKYLSLQGLFQDIFMVLFFGMASAMITKAFYGGGYFSTWQARGNVLFAGIGGAVGPIVLFFGLLYVTMRYSLGEQTEMFTYSLLRQGWGIPVASNIALTWMTGRFLFGERHPACLYVLVLAMLADVTSLVIITFILPVRGASFEPIYLLLLGGALLMSYGLRRTGVKHFGYYLVLGGVPAWVALELAQFHGSLAWAVIVPFMPFRTQSDTLETIKSHTLGQFTTFFKTPMKVGLFFFGLTSTGIVVSHVGTLSVIIGLSFIFGKTLGIVGFGYVAGKLGLRLPGQLTFRSLLVLGLVSSLGLTVAFFISEQSYTNPVLLSSAKLGVLFSLLAVPLAYGLARAFRIKRFTSELES